MRCVAATCLTNIVQYNILAVCAVCGTSAGCDSMTTLSYYLDLQFIGCSSWDRASQKWHSATVRQHIQIDISLGK